MMHDNLLLAGTDTAVCATGFPAVAVRSTAAFGLQFVLTLAERVF